MDNVMTRRQALGLAGAAAAVGVGTRATRVQSNTKPNLLFIMTDDQPPYLASPSRMPRLDRYLRQEGVDFTRGYACTPLCGPARVSLLKGKYSHNTGIISNAGTYQDFKARGLDRGTVATRLKAVGYKTGHFGKYLNGYSEDCRYVPPGWSRWFTFCGGWNNPDSFSMSSAKRGSRTATVRSFSRSRYNETDLLANRVGGFIRYNRGTPWLAYVTPNSPHDPYYVAPRHQHYADGATHSSPATEENTLEELSDKPRNVREQAPWTAGEQAKADWHTEGKMEELRAVDEMIERLVLALQETGQLANTLIIFCTDNGYMLGEHGLLKKSAPYEEAARVPFLVRGAGIGVARGKKSNALVSQLDITATMLALAGADTSGLDGRSLKPLFGGATPTSWRKRLLVEQKNVSWEMMREGNYSYTERSTGERELYNLASDPYELQSLHDDPSEQERVQGFAENLGRLRNAAGDKLRAAEVAEGTATG